MARQGTRRGEGSPAVTERCNRFGSGIGFNFIVGKNQTGEPGRFGEKHERQKLIEPHKLGMFSLFLSGPGWPCIVDLAPSLGEVFVEGWRCLNI